MTKKRNAIKLLHEMNKPTFEQFLEICELNIGEKYVSELLNIIKESDCIYSSGIIMPHNHILDIYSIRLEIAEESKKLSENEILDFKNCVNNISISTSENIGILTIEIDNKSYMIFYEPNEKKIIGIIKFQRTESLKDIENNIDDMIKKGHSSKSQKFSKGKLIKEWK